LLHGNCCSIGCIPITDDWIKEVYWLAVLVRDRGQAHLPIQIFPARLTDEGFKALSTAHGGQTKLIAFWGNLKEGYERFEKSHRAPLIKARRDGTYEFSEEIASRGTH
jgi:murein L,D-transpeptidase YafK